MGGIKPIPPEIELVAKEVVDSAFRVHQALGPGLLESVYEACMIHEFKKRGLGFTRQMTLPIIYDGCRIDAGVRLDLLAEDAVVIELKAVETLLPVHKAQLLTYLKLSKRRLGLLINFNVPLIKQGIVRMVL